MHRPLSFDLSLRAGLGALAAAAAAVTCLSGVALAGAAPGPVSLVKAPVPHEVGWVCLTVSDTRVVQVQAYNKDAPERLTTWVKGDRLYKVLEGDGPQGRVCIPAITKVGDDPLPDNTLIFERTVIREGLEKPAVAELVLTPQLETLSEATLRLQGVADGWAKKDDVWTFNAAGVLVFAERVQRGLPGEGDGPNPSSVFRGAPAMQRFAEPCKLFELTFDAVGNLGIYDARTGRVSPTGVEPFRLKKGEVVARCEGLSTDGTMLAIALRHEGGEVGWYVVPQTTSMRAIEGDGPFIADKPLGGYHLCRQPTWNSALLEEVDLAAKWELLANGEWRWLSGEDRDPTVLAAGTRVTLLSYREGWALVRVIIEGAPRTLALPGRAVAVPTGPASDARNIIGGLCQWKKGEWRATANATRAFRVAADAPGAELAGLWVEIPQGTRLLVLCQGAKGCEPIYVGGSQSSSEERFRLVRFAGKLLAVRESDLRDRVAGTFETRVERNEYFPPEDVLTDPTPAWALGVGPGARLSFVRQDDFAWAARVRLQELSPGLGFEGAIGAGGDGHGTFMELTGGVGYLFHTLKEANIELRGAALAKLDLRFADGGGLGVDLIAKGQIRWVNDYAPLSLEIGVNLGFGGTFGDDSSSGVTFGMPLWLNVELIEF